MEYKTIDTVTFSNIDTIRRPKVSEHLDMDSSARQVFTDFDLQSPLMLESTVSIQHAIDLMKNAHVHMKLVVDSRELFLGVVTLADLVSIKVTRKVEASGLSREELTVSDIMTHKEDMHAIEYTTFIRAKIGNLVATMKQFGATHLLVIDSESRSIRGISSASDIAQKLHVSLYIVDRANSFSDIYHAVHT